MLGEGIAHAFRADQTPHGAADLRRFQLLTARGAVESANGCAWADPSILDRIGSVYGKHPEAVKMLGGAALAIALGRIAKSTAH